MRYHAVVSASRRDLEGPEGGLTHNPFANLRPTGAPPPTPERPAGPPDPGDPLAARLVLSIERAGRAGKTVTRLAGLRGAAAPDLARDLARALGCGWSREADDVLLQGDQVARAADWLEERGARGIVRPR